MSYKYIPPSAPAGYDGNQELYEQHKQLESQAALNELKNRKPKANRRAYIVYLVFILLLLTAGSSIVFNGWFWGLTLLFFFVGLNGQRLESMGRTPSGTKVIFDHGAKKNTDGMPGGCCFSLAFITSYTLLAFVIHLLGMQIVNLSPIDNYGVIFFMISFIITLPLWFLFLRIFHSNTKAGWRTFGVLLVILTIISRL
jgi:hypothetical protein